MDIDELKMMLQQGESNTVEFKVRLSSDNNLAIVLSSFANTMGGKLLIGVGEKGNVKGVFGVESVLSQIQKATQTLISPPLNVNVQAAKIYGRDVVIVEVPSPSKDVPYSVGETYYQRKGSYCSLISSEKLADLFRARASNSSDRLKSLEEGIEQLSEQNVRLEETILNASNWKTKAIDYVMGAVVALVLSILLRAIF